MANEIVGWLEKKTGPPAEVLADVDAVKEFIDNNEVAVVGFFKDAESEAAKKYLLAVRDYENYPVAITSDEAAFEKNEVSNQRTLI